MNLGKWSNASLVILTMTLSNAISGADCGKVIGEHIQWMNASPLNRIKVVVSTQETTRNQLTSYVNGTIDKSSTGQISNSSVTAASMGTSNNGLRPRGRQVDGEMTQYFSDEFECLEQSPSGTFGGGCQLNNRFAAKRSDKLGIRFQSSFLGQPASVTLRLLSWGGGEIRTPPETMTCTAQGLIVSVQETGSTSITLHKFSLENPR